MNYDQRKQGKKEKKSTCQIQTEILHEWESAGSYKTKIDAKFFAKITKGNGQIKKM